MRATLSYYLRRKTAQVLGLNQSQPDLTQPLTQMGFDSLMTIELRNHIQNDLGINISVGTLLQNPTVAQLTTVLQGMISQETTSGIMPVENNPLVPIQPQGERPPLFCVPGWIGDVLYLYELGGLMGSPVPNLHFA